MSNRNFDHIALSVKDIDTSVDWYERSLQASVLYKDETWAMLEVGGIKLALTVFTQHPPHIAFAVGDIKELGAQYREHRDGSCYVYKCDPDGNTVELIYWRNNNGN